MGEYYDGETIRYFFADGVHGTFEPRDDYGPLSLYYADVTCYRDVTDEGEAWNVSEYMCAYGLMTRDGRIVTGANWTEGDLTAMDDETGVFLLRQTHSGSEYEYGYGYTSDLIALDGSWAMHFGRYVSIMALFRYGLPYFMITDGMHPTVYSAKDGSPVLSLEKYVPADMDYAYVPNVIWADETMLLVQTKNEYEYSEESSTTRNEYTALDWDGNVLYTKELVNQDLYAFDQQLNNSRLLRLSSFYQNGNIRLMNAMCEPVSDTAYHNVLFDGNSGCTLAVTGHGNGIRADYFDADGNPVSPDTGWNAVALNNLDAYDFLSGSNGAVFCSQAFHTFRDFFGNEIELPAKARYVTVLYSYENRELTLYMRSEDGFGYLLTPDGELLMKIDAPYEWQYSGDSSRYVLLETGFGRALAVYEDGTVKMFDLAAGRETYAGTLEDFFGPGTDPETYRENCSLWFLSGSLLCARQQSDITVYSITDPRILYKGVVCTRYANGIVMIATPAECIALDKDGNVLYRAGNGKMA